MKNFKKISASIVLGIVLFFGVGFLTLANAQEVSPEVMPKYEIPELQIDLSSIGVTFSDVTCVNSNGGFVCSISWISDYIAGIYQYALGIGGVLAAVMLMAGGVLWLVSGGDTGRISKAKTLITGSITGLVILFSSYMLLFQINPDLTVFEPIKIRNIARDGEPLSYDGNTTNSDACSDCIKITSIPVKGGMGTLANKDLIAKLEKAYQATPKDIPWRITEAYPPSQKHKSKCHNNGMCVDIAILSGSNSCTNVAKLEAILRNFGLAQILNEYTDCGGTKTTFSSGGHFHLR